MRPGGARNMFTSPARKRDNKTERRQRRVIENVSLRLVRFGRR